MKYDSIAVMIPAYKPDMRLVTLVDDLLAGGFSKIVVIDDGGGEAFRPIFDLLLDKATVLVHEVNRGKGAALKTGLTFLAKEDVLGVVTADADGQHTPADCAKVADGLLRDPEALILGSRDKGQMPPRSKFGNTATCLAFFLSTFHWISDTQTGLRGIPKSRMEDMSHLDGDRYEYELNMLLYACHSHMTVTEITIETIYIDDNKSSHFHAIRDGARIYGLLFRQGIRYTASAILSWLMDYGMFTLLSLFSMADWICVYGARLVSSAVNYIVNRELVFKGDKRPITVVKYYILAVAVILGTMGLFKLFTGIGMNRYVAQPLSNLILFLISYPIQKKFIFGGKKQ